MQLGRKRSELKTFNSCKDQGSQWQGVSGVNEALKTKMITGSKISARRMFQDT